MNIKERKKQILENTKLLEKDIKTLEENIRELKEILPSITTEEDAKKFDENFDIENGLEFIHLF